MTINFLPNDVLLEILARLPVKSLLRFRSVAKSWRDILKDPTFITKHHLTQVALNRGNCFLSRTSVLDPGASEFVLVVEDEQGVKCTSLELPFLKDSNKTHPETEIEIVGPCNGIVVISDIRDDYLFLWNPATKEYKALASTSVPPSLPDNLNRAYARVGFGIDPITKDYKVVRIWDYCRTKYDFVYKVEVLSLSASSCRPKSESWKIIDAALPFSDHQPLFKSDHVYLNGKYYWCTEAPACWLGMPCRILWFDMGAEVFGLIELPNLCADSYENRLGVLKESLAMVRHAYTDYVEDKYGYEIWIMDRSDGFSWNKYASVEHFMDYCDVPLGFWKNEELVVSTYNPENDPEDELFCYDIKTHATKKIMQGVYLEQSRPLAIYNESLVSVVGEN